MRTASFSLLVFLGALTTAVFPAFWILAERGALTITPVYSGMMLEPGAFTGGVAVYQLWRGASRTTAWLAFIGGLVIFSIPLWGPFIGFSMEFGLKMIVWHFVAGALSMIGAVALLRSSSLRPRSGDGVSTPA